MSQIKFSILIRSIESRSDKLSYLVTKLTKQCGQLDSVETKKISSCSIIILRFVDVEVIMAIDNKEITSGGKANILISVANGVYICFIDDDNGISEDYVEEIIKATDSGADTFAINGEIFTNGADRMRWFLSKDNPNSTVKMGNESVYLRTTNHLSPTKKEFALQAGFPPISNGEDAAYSKALQPLLKTEHIINNPLYTYHFVSKNKEY